MRAWGRLVMPGFIVKEDLWGQHAGAIWELLEGKRWPLPVIVADNVADYYFSGTDQEIWDLGTDFANMAPPFPLFWVEHKLPSLIRSRVHGDSDLSILGPRGRMGVLVAGLDPEQVRVADGELLPGTRWVLSLEVFIEYGFQPGEVQGPHGTIFLCLDADGRLLGKSWMQGYHDPETNDLVVAFIAYTHPTLLAISFMHCKNVRVVDEQVPPKLAKRYAERHAGLRPTNYKTIVIEPMKAVLRRTQQEHGVGHRAALHICRGHFKDYRAGAGLFGKYHGTFWWDQAVHGTKSQTPPAREYAVKLDK
jgi:hypothetical protein